MTENKEGNLTDVSTLWIKYTSSGTKAIKFHPMSSDYNITDTDRYILYKNI